jgi:hypothetical protein
VSTQNPNFVDTYQFKLVCTEPSTQVKNQQDVFNITIGPPTFASEFVFSADSLVADFVYWLGGPETQVGPYEY